MKNGNGIHLAASSRGRFDPVAFVGTKIPVTGPEFFRGGRVTVPWFAKSGWGIVLCAAYPILAVGPMICVNLLRHEAGHALGTMLAINCALAGFSLLSLQFVLTARFSWLEAPFGLDVVLRFHRAMALAIVALLCAHPLILGGTQGWALLIRPRTHWYLWAGRIALILLTAQVAMALFRMAMRLSYERWRWVHNVLAVAILELGFAHAMRTGDDLHGTLGLMVIGVPLGVALAALLYSRVVRPLLLARRAFRVQSVRSETPGVWTVTLQPPPGLPFRFLPGQFQFVRFLDSDVPAEEHPFTIASSPTAADRISLTIKACGNFTNLIDQILPGERAIVHGPFGRFSHELHPDQTHLVFVAGGVGITPLMSMLRAMRAHGDTRRVTLVYASRTLDDILFTSELIAMESDGRPALDVVHVLSDPPPWWSGQAGRVDVHRLAGWSGGLEEKSFYLCCPPPMSAALVRGLRRRGVSPKRIHCDYFSL